MNRLKSTAALASFIIALLFVLGLLNEPLFAAKGQKKPFKKTHLLFWQGTFESAMEMAKTLHKPMFLDFYEPNQYDKQLDSAVYRDPDVMYFINATCLAYRINEDAIDSASKALIAQYNVQEFPTAMVTKSDGTEIDRIVGYYPPKQFLLMVENFLNDTNTIGKLRRRWNADTNDLSLAYQLARRFELRFEVDSAMNMMRYIIAHGKDTSLLVQNATFELGAFDLRAFGNPNILTAFAHRTRVDSLRKSAYHELFMFYESRKQPANLYATYDSAISHFPKNADLYNNYAWARAEWNDNLDTALTLAERAVALNPDIPDYYDTMAEIYAGKKDFASAIKEIKKALWLKRNDPYLLEREKKFRTALARARKNAK